MLLKWLRKKSEMPKFKVGDKVKVKTGYYLGTTGKIAFIRDSSPCRYMVLFDKNVDMLGRDGNMAKEAIHKGYDYRKCWVYDDEELELVEEEKKMENVKSLLKSGDVVVNRGGIKYKVFLDYETEGYGKGIFSNYDGCGRLPIKRYDKNLTFDSCDRFFDIMKIYRAKREDVLMSDELHYYNLVWERNDIKEMTMEEICKALGYDVKIKKEEK